MSFQTFVTKRLAAITAQLNAIATNSKRIFELPVQTNLDPTSLIHVSRDGISESLEVQKIINAVVSGSYDQLLAIGEITLSGNVATIPAYAQWKIDEVYYGSIANITRTIPYCATGLTRKDILVANTSNDIVLVQGVETAGITVRPNIPMNTVLVTEMDVTDASVGTPTPPIIGDAYISKSEKTATTFTGSGTYETVTINPGSSYLVVTEGATGPVVKINRLDMPDDCYDGQDLYIFNWQGSDLTIGKYASGYPSAFTFRLPKDEDLVIPRLETLHFRILKSSKSIVFVGLKPNDGFTEQKVRDTVLTGLTDTTGVLSATDKIIEAFGKIKKSLADMLTSIGLKADKTYVDTQDTATLNTAKSYTDTGLATKADLVGGKVPQSQSQGSNLTYNSVNGVITLTDPAGVNHTIDLPIENLFQNAGYDSGTRSLTLTTNGGGTIVVPLSDLVDLPEIVVSANANPVAVPTTGQRLYLRSDNGSYWIASAGAWAGPFLGVTAAEKTTWNGKETAFAKNTAFNKNFGTAAGTTMEGNDSRANNGQTAFSWGNHAGLYRSSSYVPSWSEVTGKPSTFTPSAHTHAIADVTGLQGALDGKQPSGSYVLTNDTRLSDSRPASDVYTWAKQSTKPSYVFSEIGTKPTTLSGYGITDGVTSTGGNASGTWNINIQGASTYSYKLYLDDSVMSNTIYGNYMGLRQSYAGAPNTLGGMPDSNWYTSIKLLHNSSSGYFSEIASNFTGVSTLYHRNMTNGVLSNWTQLIDKNNIGTSDRYFLEKVWMNFGSLIPGNSYSWVNAAFTTNSIEIVTGDTETTNRSPTLAFHRYGSGGPQFRLDPTGTNVLYLESSYANSARNGNANVSGGYFTKLKVVAPIESTGDIIAFA